MGLGRIWPPDPDCPSPDNFAKVLGSPGFAVAVNTNGEPARPAERASTLFRAWVVLMVKNVDACPAALVKTGWAFERLPPPAVTTKVTATDFTGIPLSSVTCTTNGLGNC